MQQQEITRRVEFLFESAAGRGLRNRPYTATPQAKITMVRPIRARRKERGILLMLLNKLRRAAAKAGETPAIVPAEVLAASLSPSSFNSVSGEDM
jgi:hypothetical protein